MHLGFNTETLELYRHPDTKAVWLQKEPHSCSSQNLQSGLWGLWKEHHTEHPKFSQTGADKLQQAKRQEEQELAVGIYPTRKERTTEETLMQVVVSFGKKMLHRGQTQRGKYRDSPATTFLRVYLTQHTAQYRECDGAGRVDRHRCGEAAQLASGKGPWSPDHT